MAKFSKQKISRRQAIGTYAASVAAMTLPVTSPDQPGMSTLTQTKDNRVALVTGGARGIGFETARALANQGVSIVIFDIARQIDSVMYPLSTMETLTRARQEIESAGVKCLAIQGDVRSLSSLKDAVREADRAFGRIDFLVANAAFTSMGDIESASEQLISDMMEVNIGGVAKSVQAVLPLMKKQNRGRIVTLSSITGRGGSQYFSIYSATKWAVIGLTKSLAMELGQYNITCNAVCPTIINTPMVNNGNFLNAINQSAPTMAALDGFAKTIHTIGKGVLEPVEIANTIKFLCSDEASCISGSVIDVSAGYMARNNA